MLHLRSICSRRGGLVEGWRKSDVIPHASGRSTATPCAVAGRCHVRVPPIAGCGLVASGPHPTPPFHCVIRRRGPRFFPQDWHFTSSYSFRYILESQEALEKW